MSYKGYIHQKDIETPLLSQHDNIKDIADSRVRYVTLGIVKMVEPLKNTQENAYYFVVFDSFEQNMISFNIDTLYEKFIKNGIDYIKTAFGQYKLSQKTIDDITRLCNKSFQSY